MFILLILENPTDCAILIFRLVLPLITREVISLLHPGYNESETVDLSTYGFLYGTFPSAPGVFVFATQYNTHIDLVCILTTIHYRV